METACMEIHKALGNVIYVTLKTSVRVVSGLRRLQPNKSLYTGNASVRHLHNVGLEIGSFCFGTMAAHSVSGISGFQPALIRIARN